VLEGSKLTNERENQEDSDPQVGNNSSEVPEGATESGRSARSAESGTNAKQSSGIASKWIGVVGSALFFLLINLPFQYRSFGYRGIQWEEKPHDFGLGVNQDFNLVEPVEAGWPLRFYIKHSFGQAEHHVRFTVTSLALNLVIAACVIAITYVYLQRKQKRGTQLSLADLLVTVTLLGVALGYWQFLERQEKADREVVRELMQSGKVVRQSYWPAVIGQWLPSRLRRSGSRITAVSIDVPNDDQVELITNLPHLRSLRLGGGTYDKHSLNRLPSMRYLQDLRLAGTELEPETVAALSDCELVRQLNLTHSNLANDALAYLGKMPQLSRLMALKTFIPDKAWQESELKDKLEVLLISRPDSGESGEILFHSWSKLRRLSIDSLEEPSNVEVFKVSIRDMPKLERLEIDAFQLVDLELEKMPKFTSLVRPDHHSMFRTAVGEERPAASWVRRLRFSELPALDSLRIHVGSVETIDIDNCAAINSLVATSELKSGSGNKRYDLNVERDRVQHVIECFGRPRGPKEVAVKGVNLSEVSLTPLAKNPRIQSVDFRSCKLPQSFADQLATSTIRSIDLRRTNADSEAISRLVDKLSTLESLSIDSRIQEVRFKNHDKLKTLLFDQHFQPTITVLHLENLSEFSSPLVVSPTVDEVHIENVLKFPGLAMLGTPRKFELSGVNGLSWFFGGGPSCDDAVVSELMKARGITHLTIGYSPASSQSYSELGSLRELVELRIPAANLDDDTIVQWDIPMSLNALDVRDCGLSANATKRLIARGSWDQLHLSGNEIDASTLLELNGSRDLNALSLGAVSITKSFATKLDVLQAVTELDLAGATIESGALTEIFAKAPNLKQINLTGATADWSEILPAIRANRDLKFRLSPVDATVSLITKLTNEKKLIMERSRSEVMFQSQRGVFKGFDQNGLPRFEADWREEDPGQFQRPDWSPDLFRRSDAT
jgi:hypothetical protein